jgi:RNA polymerase sigma-70 factor (ECF subfamily)
VNRDLVAGAIAGDREAYTELVRQSIDRSYAIAGLILRDPDRARDATQEAYVMAWRGLSALRDPGRFDAWLRRLVVRACYDEIGRERRHRHVEISEIDIAGTMRTAVADSTIDFALRDQLERGFRLLKPDQRAVLVLRHYVDLTIEETADAMGVPVGTAKSRLNRATSAMRAILEADARASRLAEGPVA